MSATTHKSKKEDAKETKQEIVTITENASQVATHTLGSEFEEFAGQGLENVTSKDILIPRITIIQSLSPQILKNKSEYIPEAKVGDICDVATSELLPNPLIVIPVYFAMQWLEWAPRETGKGLVNIHPTDDILKVCVQNEKGRWYTTTKNLIEETAQFFILNMSAEGRRSFVPMKGTQLKKSRLWLTMATGERLSRSDGSLFVPPLFYRSYQLSVATESNTNGTWEGWKIERHISITEFDGYKYLLDEAKEFRNALSSGTIRADIDSMKDEVEEATGIRPMDASDQEGTM